MRTESQRPENSVRGGFHRKTSPTIPKIMIFGIVGQNFTGPFSREYNLNHNSLIDITFYELDRAFYLTMFFSSRSIKKLVTYHHLLRIKLMRGNISSSKIIHRHTNMLTPMYCYMLHSASNLCVYLVLITWFLKLRFEYYLF